MYDQDTVKDNEKFLSESGLLSRRQFNSLAVGVALAKVLPRAAATFHGGGLATDAADSPHLLIPQMKAHFLIAIAANDDEKEPEAKDTLRAAFAAADLPAEVEVYQDTLHGWCPPDSQVYNEAQAERAWSRLLVLFESTLV